MPTILFLIIAAGLAGILAVCIPVGVRMSRRLGLDTSVMEVFTWMVAAIAAIGFLVVFSLGITSSIKRVPEDHVRVLSRSGESFRILDNGTYWIWEVIPFDEHNISRRWRTSSFSPAEGETRDGVQKLVNIDENGQDWDVNVTVDWRIKSDGEYIESAWHTVRRHSRELNPGAKLEDRMWHKEVADNVREAVENCSDNHIFSTAETSEELNEIERCIEKEFAKISDFRYRNEDASLYEVRNARNVRVFRG